MSTSNSANAQQEAAAIRVRREPSSEEFTAMRNSEQFQKLRRTYRQFTFPMSVAFFLWFTVYVFTAVYASEWMAQPLWGLNIGIWFGLAQFVTTFLITFLYVVYANRNIEPQAAAIREAMEG